MYKYDVTYNLSLYYGKRISLIFFNGYINLFAANFVDKDIVSATTRFIQNAIAIICINENYCLIYVCRECQKNMVQFLTDA
jgi:hypothetical protein